MAALAVHAGNNGIYAGQLIDLHDYCMEQAQRKKSNAMHFLQRTIDRFVSLSLFKRGAGGVIDEKSTLGALGQLCRCVAWLEHHVWFCTQRLGFCYFQPMYYGTLEIEKPSPCAETLYHHFVYRVPRSIILT